MKEWRCPKCGNLTTEHPAISREDNHTKICPSCGVYEALEAFRTAKKEEYLKFIKGFSRISINRICQEKNLNRSNILNGRASAEATWALYQEIANQIQDLLNDLQI